MCNKVIKICIPQEVRIRKYKIDNTELSIFLRQEKQKSKLSNKQIAKLLNKPITLVEHWFRKDKSFSIPDEKSWFELKKVFNCSSTKYDELVTTFTYKQGDFEQNERHYFDIGLSPTLTTSCDEYKIIVTR